MVAAVVCVKAAGMKQAWRLAASDGALSPQQIVALYGKRALRQTMVHPTELPRQQGHTLWHGPERTADRRSSTPRRLLPLNAFATFLLTILCAAGESLGMDRQLQTRTAKRRVHSLFRQKLRTLRPHSQHAGTKAAASDRKIRRFAGSQYPLRRSLRPRLK